jgi:hypothetical protein
LTKKHPWFILVAELTMTEKNSQEPGTIPEPDDSKKQPSGAVLDPGQTRLLPPMAAVGEHKRGDAPVNDPASVSGLVDGPGLVGAKGGWFKKLSQPQIISISLAIILIFLTVFLSLIIQGQHKNKILRSKAGEQLEESGKTASINTSGILSGQLARRQAAGSILLLSDDEFAGQAPVAVKAGGPVISAAIDPEMAAMVDALKKRFEISVEGKASNRGNAVTRTSKGSFRGFLISVEEKTENWNSVFEEVAVTTPQKGFIKTINRILESVKASDLGRFTDELRAAGLEMVNPALQPGTDFFRVQFKTSGIYGKPIAPDLLISGKSLGKISLGMSTTQLETILLSSYVVLKRKVLVNDIYYDVYKVLDQSNEPLFFVYENKGLVWGIAIINEIFKTERGIGINSSLGEMRINYPQVGVGISEKKTPFVKIDGVDGLFVIQSEGVDIQRHSFPNTSKIISILIGNSLDFE